MIFEDTFTVQAPVERVWAFLRDPRQVGACIPGTERIEVLVERHYRVVAGARVSFLSVSFSLNVTVTAGAQYVTDLTQDDFLVFEDGVTLLISGEVTGLPRKTTSSR